MVPFTLNVVAHAGIALVEGVEALAYGAIIYTCAAYLAAWLIDRLRLPSLLKLLTRFIGKAACLAIIAALLIFSPLLALLLQATSEQQQPPSSPSSRNNTACQCEAPSQFSFMTVECNGQSHNAAFSVVHDLNAIDQVVEDLSHVASGSFASLKDEWKDQAKKFVYSRDTLRHQYSRLQSKSIPRFINSGRQMLLGEADDDCVEVEWIAVNVGFEDLQETGSDCQNLWWNVYEEHGSATRLTDMITAGLRQLEDPSIKRIALLLPGMNGQDRRNSHDLLTEALSLMASLREAHASRQEIACSDSERRIMEASWRKATLKNIAGVAVRKDQSHTDLDNLVAQRLDWPMLHTSPDLAGLD